MHKIYWYFYQLLYKDIFLHVLDLTAVPEYFLYPLCLLSLAQRVGILRTVCRTVHISSLSEGQMAV